MISIIAAVILFACGLWSFAQAGRLAADGVIGGSFAMFLVGLMDFGLAFWNLSFVTPTT